MEVVNSLIDFFELNPDIKTFTDLIIWFSKLMMSVVVICTVTKALFKATWKTEKMMR